MSRGGFRTSDVTRRAASPDVTREDGRSGPTRPSGRQMVLDLAWRAGSVPTWPRVAWPLADARNAVTLDVLDALLRRAGLEAESRRAFEKGVGDEWGEAAARASSTAPSGRPTSGGPEATVPWVYVYGRRETGLDVLIERVLEAGTMLAIEMGRWQAAPSSPGSPRLGSVDRDVSRGVGSETPEGTWEVRWPALLLIERVESRCADPAEAEALFHTLNEARDRGVTMLLVADRPPDAVECVLEDLRSRLGWGGVFAWRAPDDDVLAQLVELEAARSGIDLRADVRDFLLTRGPRRADAQLALFDALAEQALAEQRRLTQPFARRWWNARERAVRVARADRQRRLFESDDATGA